MKKFYFLTYDNEEDPIPYRTRDDCKHVDIWVGSSDEAGTFSKPEIDEVFLTYAKRFMRKEIIPCPEE